MALSAADVRSWHWHHPLVAGSTSDCRRNAGNALEVEAHWYRNSTGIVEGSRAGGNQTGSQIDDQTAIGMGQA